MADYINIKVYGYTDNIDIPEQFYVNDEYDDVLELSVLIDDLDICYHWVDKHNLTIEE